MRSVCSYQHKITSYKAVFSATSTQENEVKFEILFKSHRPTEDLLTRISVTKIKVNSKYNTCSFFFNAPFRGPKIQSLQLSIFVV
jgi:hypothetical protein